MTSYNFDKLQNENNFEYKVRLCVAKLNKEHDYDWSELINLLRLNCSPDHLRKLSYAYKEMLEEQESKDFIDSDIKYKETTEILNDGTQKSDKLVTMSAEQSKDVNYLLSAHGFDVNAWELVSARNNIWNTNSKTQGVQTLYSSKITVKPKKDAFDFEKIVENAIKNVKPIHINQNYTNDNQGLLEIPLFDMHFGIADLDYYSPTYEKIVKRINSNKWDTILFIIGQDLIHNDGFRGKTTSGTIIESVNIENAFNDALNFYINLIELALKQSKNVEVIFSSGNHDETIGYGFVRTLKATFPQIKFDHELKTRKGFTWNKVFIATTHGDKGHARMVRNVMDEFRNEILYAKVAEIHSGHLHSEKSKDEFGIVSRTLGTGAKTDDWHYEQGFVGSMKRFQLFEYSYDSLDAMYYV